MLTDAALRQYWAVHRSVGLLELDSRGKVRAEGPDRVSFLHSMISNDVEALEEGCGRYGTFLTATGRMLADFHYYKLADFILLDIEKVLLPNFVQTMEKFIIMDDVTLKDVSGQWVHYSIQGPKAGELTVQLFGERLPQRSFCLREFDLEGASGWMVPLERISERGCDILVRAEGKAESVVRERLHEVGEDLGMAVVGPDAYDILRLERGVPLFGVDMDESNNPLEARLDAAVSLTKGCYIGQEVIAKATHIGGVNRLLVRLRVEGETLPATGSPVLDRQDKRIGKITSAGFSPRLQTGLALAYVRRAHSRPKTELTVESSQGNRISVQVVEDFYQ